MFSLLFDPSEKKWFLEEKGEKGQMILPKSQKEKCKLLLPENEGEK